MDISVLALEASSPEELTAVLAKLSGEYRAKFRYAALAVSGPQVLVRIFELDNVPAKEIKNRLKYESVELLSLPVDDIELDFQIFVSAAGKVSGVFACLPKKLFKNYIAVLDKVKLVPVKVTARILAVIDGFFRQQKIDEERFCTMDFSLPQIVNLAVFRGRQCEFLREIPYENPAEAGREVVRSLQSACAKSSEKQFENIYFLGDTAGAEGLMTQVAGGFNKEVKIGNFTDVSAALCGDDNYFSLNLARDYALSRAQRAKILKSAQMAILAFLVINVGLAVKMLVNKKSFNDITSSYSQSDYEHAKRLEDKLNSL